MTLMQVAAACSVWPTTVKRWEKGVIPQEHLPALAELLGASVPFLTGWTDQEAA